MIRRKLKRDIEKDIDSSDMKKWEEKADEYIDNKEKSDVLLSDAAQKAEKYKNGPIREVWEKIHLLFDVFRDFTNGSYRQIPVGSVIAIAAAIIYFVAPIDIIPDWIVGLGLIDDTAVIGYVVRQVGSDLDKYKQWRDSKIIQVNYKFDSSEMDSE